MNYIIINGKKSTFVQGLLISTLPPITKPLKRTLIEEIDGRDGDIITELGYSAYDKTFTIGLFGKYDVNNVIEYFDSEGEIIFSNEPDKVYKFKQLEQIDLERLIRFKTAEITLHVQPFKYSAVDKTVTRVINKILTIPNFTETENGITVEKIGENTIRIHGTATEATEIEIDIPQITLQEGNYTMYLETSGTNPNACMVKLYDTDNVITKTFGGRGAFLGIDTFIRTYIEHSKTFNKLLIDVIPYPIDVTLTLSLVKGTFDSVEIYNEGNTFSKPKITLYGSGNVTLFIANYPVLTMVIDDYITIDAEALEAYKGHILKNRQVAGDYNKVRFERGLNIVSWRGNVSKIEIENYSRWI